nr:TetR/AcrR family transcriptional regulator [uncultured Dongia sp.]
MDNTSRSERTRGAVIQAALAIIARDGPGRLTLDAIARESGISKGGLMHQFRTKQAVLRALLDHQIAYFEDFSRRYMAAHDDAPQPNLAAEIATSRETIAKPHSVAMALFSAVAEEPGLMSVTRASDAQKIAAIKAEAGDPDLAVLRWSAARGLALTSLLGLCPLSKAERERLFERLLDDQQWSALAKPAKTKSASARAPRKKA